MRLSTAKIQNATAQKKTVRLFDGRGLYLEIAPTGSRWWRFKYRFAGKEKRISLGVYPDVGLKKARDRRDERAKLVADGIDPKRRAQTGKTHVPRCRREYLRGGRARVVRETPGELGSELLGEAARAPL
jgi:hypothetical protein